MYYVLRSKDGLAIFTEFDNIPNDYKSNATQVEGEIPVAEERKGQSGIMYFDESSQSVKIRYESRPLNDQEKMEDLESRNAELETATLDLANMIATQDSQLKEQSEALLDLANTLSEVMNNG